MKAEYDFSAYTSAPTMNGQKDARQVKRKAVALVKDLKQNPKRYLKFSLFLVIASRS